MAGAEWTEPGAHPVAPGVWRLPLPLPNDALRAVNVYAVADTGGLTLIDGGWALEGGEAHLERALAELGAGLGDVRRFLVTHAHRDHYTQAIAVRRRFGTRVLLGAGEKVTVERLRAPGHGTVRAWAELLLRYGAGPVVATLRAADRPAEPADTGYEAPDAYIGEGELFELDGRVLEAVPTPGHTRGHVVFLDRAAGVLFAGDHVLPHISPSVGFEVDPPPLALADYLRSLRLVRELPDALLLPAHGPSGDRVHARVDALLAHHDDRLAEAAAALAAGPRTPYEVAGELGWTRRRRPFAGLDPFNQMLAVFETALHLELLVHRGRAAVRTVDGVAEYRTAGGVPEYR